jgi:pimeloyl-ACP methyl ester carboxylesterase
MTTEPMNPRRPSGRARVIALHCSGGGASQWCALAEALGGRYELLAPEHYGCESTGAWTGEHAFALADEASRVLALIDASPDKVHLVGHSYGGGVALNVALARPGRVASMALYEPSAFHLLRWMGGPGAEADAEIAAVARRISDGVVAGDNRGAMSVFVDYWNGPGAWNALRPEVQLALIRWAPKSPLDFRALIEEGTEPGAYRVLDFPVLVLHGERAPGPTRLIADYLQRLLPASRLAVIDRAGHMGPITHACEVNGAIARHIAEVAAGQEEARAWRPRRLANLLGAASRPAKAAS